MKNVLRVLVLSALVPVAVLAQSSANLDEEVNAELDKMYQAQLQQQAGSSTTGNGNQTQVTTQVTVPLTVANQSGAANLSQPVQTQVVAQKQPTTVIEASPLTDSRAERIRKSRQDAELQTEQSIVEKLEQSRLEDEKRRAEALFGDKFNTMMQQQQQQQAAVVVQQQGAGQQTAVVAVDQNAAAVVAVPEVVVERNEDKKEESKELDREAIRGEVSAALAEMKKEEEKPKNTTYVAAILGAGDYPDAKNVRGQYALGAEVGMRFNDRLIAAGSFLYSNYQVEQRDGGCMYDQFGNYSCYPRVTEMNQYSTSALVKYQLLGGMLRPEIGGLLSYTYRTFADTQFAISDQTASSQAFDMGVQTGLSLELTESFALGFDFRYMWNLTSRYDNSFQSSYVQPYLKTDKPIEQLNYYTVGVSAKATF